MSETAEIDVLHVDDESDFVELAADMLKREDSRFSIETATSASKGLDQLTDEEFDCIVSDYDMPGTNGIEFLEGVREEYPDLPFILYTGKGSEEVASDAISAGATDYVQKGRSTDQYELLANRIDAAVSRQRAESNYREIFEKATDGIIVHDPETGEILDANRRRCEMLGYTRDELIGQGMEKITASDSPYTAEQAHQRIQQALDGEPQVFEWVDETRTGDRLTVEVHLKHTSIGGQECVLAFVRDISERKERKQAIEDLHSTAQAFMEAKSGEEIAETAVEAANGVIGLPVSAIHLYDAEANALAPIAWTDPVEEIIDTPPTFPAGKGLAWDVFEADELQVYADVSTVPGRWNPDTDVRSEIILPLGDHGVFMIGSKTPDEFDERDISLAETLATHVTTALDRIEHEQRLREYKTLVETVGDTMFILDEEGYFQMANNALLSHLDADEETVIGAHASDFMTDESFERGADIVQDLVTDSDRERETYEITAVTTGGVQIPAEVNLTPLTDNSGDVTGSVGVVRDITERKEREQELERQNERLDKFASVVSHDLRNPLNVASGRLELAQLDCDSDHLDDVADALDRMETLTDDLLTLARQGEQVQETEPVMLAEMVDGCWQSVKTADATLVCDTEQRLQANKSRLKQLLENVFRNAVEHGGDDVTVTVCDLDDRDGFYIADDGPGIPDDERDEVFEAGYSTDDDGTGFGLNIVREIAEAHGWDIVVTDSESSGARFEITGVETDA